ncbi:DsbA family protein [Polyangium spumosum]|uniref:Thioredoxin domain-containing protein n=1 Tax=Polyangium spumosum TaxID=889282 RepID=A0A6N7PQ08_9BACT|nr:thioredoxin domain-containing protein [Polyangium spumosum]MRG94138.1 thioredoxin domain-containing protein [Polyangium spumosum]
MLVKLYRIGFVTALSAAIACGPAPAPQAASPGAGSQGPSDQAGAAQEGAESADKGAALPRAARAGGEGDGELAVAGSGRGPRDDVGGFPPRPVAPAEVGNWTGGNEVDTGEGAKSPVPVTAADPSWGSPKAPVTIVAFSDLECPFCGRAAGTLADLARIYGKDQLRIVWKNFPLDFHKNARPAAEAAMAVFKLKGAPWFWAYHDALFAGRIDPQVIDGSLPRGLTRKNIDAALASGDIARKVQDDIDLGKKVGVMGTPAFFINGVHLSGAQPVDKFRAIIDEQIAAARKATAGGTAPEKVYAVLSAQNYQKPEDRPDARPSQPAEDTKTVWRVPVDGSPVRGKNTALVTLVTFTDFQCPFCIKVTPTLEQLARDYGDKLRIVYKNNPLPFHKDAEPAAELALEARAQKGDAAFWKAHDLLFAQNGKLAPEDLESVARSLGIDLKKASAAIENKKHKARIEQDQDLADDVQATGTPHFFINGRRLVGAQPIDKFKALIDEEITKAEVMVKKGTPAAKLYDTLIKDGKAATFEKVPVPAVTKDNPSRGPANAKVVVQIFSDFECPFCKRVGPTLDELQAAFPGKLRFVWRNKPLPFHKNAMPAAMAAMEAYKQKGNDAFWKMHDAFFQDQTQLDRAGIERTAAALGLDVQKVLAAIDGQTHKALIDADLAAADKAKVSGTPAFVINGYFISGAQPLGKFKKAVSLALKEAK